MTLAANDPRHGTANGYKNLRCRCDACRNAWNVYFTEWRHRTGRNRPRAEFHAEVAATAARNHGTEGTYRRCKCTLCRDAAAVARRKRREANRDADRAYQREYKRRRRAS